MTWIGYIIIIGYIAITFRAVLMGINKMTRTIIGNYLAGVTGYAFGNLIHQRANRLSSSPDSVFLGISYSRYASFLSSSQLTIVLLLFVLLIRLVYSYSRIQISFNAHSNTEKLYFIILIPLTVLSFIIGPFIALKADGIVAISYIESTLKETFGFLTPFINNFPFWMFITGIVFIIISSEINFKISVSAKATKVPEGI